jgi:hypothetical protein
MFPGGSKHRFLNGSTEEELVNSLRMSISELSPGVSRVLDFREGGLKGLRLLDKAVEGTSTIVHPFGRLDGSDDIDELLELVSGLGIPSLDQVDMNIRRRCREMGKPFSFHASELFREDISRILDVEPDLLIHMISGTWDDWVSISERNIPVVVCPRSNHAFGMEVPLGEMTSVGLPLGIGTDNSMTVRQDMFREMEFSWILLRKLGSNSDVARTVFEMATADNMPENGVDTIPNFQKWSSTDWLKKGSMADLMVLRDIDTSKDPIEQIVRFSSQEDVVWS